MPEYAALIHHHEAAADSSEPPEVNEMDAMFLNMERAGIGSIN